MRTNRAGTELLKGFETFKPTPYIAPEQIGTDKRTIGYGHVILEGETFPEPLTQAQAEELLARDLAQYELAVRKAVKTTLTGNQFSALVLFVFNVGEPRFKKSTLLRLVNTHNMAAAAMEFERWNHSTIEGKLVEMDGLTARRKAERDLFLAADSQSFI